MFLLLIIFKYLVVGAIVGAGTINNVLFRYEGRSECHIIHLIISKQVSYDSV